MLLKGYRSFEGIIFGISHTSIVCTATIFILSRDGVCWVWICLEAESTYALDVSPGGPAQGVGHLKIIFPALCVW